MKAVICLVCCVMIGVLFAEVMKDYTGTDLQKCVNCLCHARSGNWSRFECAEDSVPFEYWQVAGSPTVSEEDNPRNRSSYDSCMKNENCIQATIIGYTESFGEIDCNCDGKFDCKDRFAIHLNGSDCMSPHYGIKYSVRFNECAGTVGVHIMQANEADLCEELEAKASSTEPPKSTS